MHCWWECKMAQPPWKIVMQFLKKLDYTHQTVQQLQCWTLISDWWKLKPTVVAAVVRVVQSCPTPCDPTDCSIPGFSVLHHLLELVQTHVHWVSDAIQTSHPCHPLLLLPSIFPSIRIFSNELTLHIRWPKYWSFSFSISLSNEWWSPWGHKESDTTEQLKNNNKMWKEPQCPLTDVWLSKPDPSYIQWIIDTRGSLGESQGHYAEQKNTIRR